ncbi:Slc47a2, partial [Symbiodinium microadriaticum]
LFAQFQYQGILAYLRNVSMPQPAMWIAGSTSVLHIAWAMLFIVAFKGGNLGAGSANVVTWTLQWLLGSVVMTCKSSALHVSWKELLLVQRPAFTQWRAFLNVAVPATIQICSEWWFWELCALIVGYLGPVQLAGHVATLNLVALLFMPTIALGNASASVVGNAIGAQLPRKAKYGAWLCVGLDALMWTVLAVILLVMRDFVPKLLTSKEAVQDLVQKLLTIYLLAGYPDNMQNVMGATLRGMGKQKAASVVYLISFYVIMLPVGCALVWPAKLGVEGMWYSMGIGTGLVVLGCILYKVNWAECARESEERMRANAIKEGISPGTSTPSSSDV